VLDVVELRGRQDDDATAPHFFFGFWRFFRSVAKV
jgi:hypothetical protein